MVCEYSHTDSENLAQIHAAIAKIQFFFYGIVFLSAHPVELRLLKNTNVAI